MNCTIRLGSGTFQQVQSMAGLSALGNPTSLAVRVALRRITPAGTYDPNFGQGTPSVIPPAAGRYYQLNLPVGGVSADDEYTRITPIGIAWITGRLYVVATGWSGGRYVVRSGLDTRLPLYPLLLILAWTNDAAVDQSLAGTGKH